MTKIYLDFDFRLIEIEAELSALSDYLAALEEQLQFLRDQKSIQMKADLQAKGLDRDEAEVSIAHQDLYHQTEYVYPKSFRSSFVVSLWAVYESAINEIADFIQTRTKKSLKMADLRGDDFLDRAKKYFDHVLEFPLHIDNELHTLYVIRNGIAHANGRLSAMNKNIKPKIEKLLKKQIGLSEQGGNVLIEKELLSRLYTAVNDSLLKLIKSVREWDDRNNSTKEAHVS